MQYTFIFTTLITYSIFSYAGENMLHAYKQVVVNASAAEAWELVGDYNSLNKWHPAVKTSELNGNVRLLTLTDDAAIYDELTMYNAAEKFYTYRLIKSPLPLYGYVGSMIVKDNGNKTSTIIWESRFYADGVSDNEAVKIINGVYEGGLQSLKIHFNQ